VNPLGNRAQVEALARLLEGGVSSGGAAASSTPHVMLAMRLRALGATLDSDTASPLVPRTDFRTALRRRLIAVAQVQAATAEVPFAEPVARPSAFGAVTEAVSAWTQSSKAQKRLGVTAGAMAGVIAFTGVGMAASKSLPGQAFYGLKRGAESFQLQLASGDQAKGSKHLEFAATRLREVKALADGDDLLSLAAAPGTAQASGLAFGGSLEGRIIKTLADFNAETSSGRMLLEGVYRDTGKPEPLRLLKSFSTEQSTRLTALLPDLPAESVSAAQESLTLVKQVQSAATEQLALGICGGECFPGNAGPTLPSEPEPSPGVTASPTASNDNNGVGSCSCAPVPGPEPTESSDPDPSPSPDPEPSPTPTPTPSSSPEPSLLPLPLPLPLPTILPTLLPLPTVLPSLLPSLPIVNEPLTLPVIGTLP
jgi:hypothetical protein